MAFDYVKFAKKAQTIINDNGREVKLIKRSETPADPLRPWEGTTVTEEVCNLTVIFVPSGSIQGAMGLRSMFRESEVIEKRQAFVAALDLPDDDLEDFDFVQDGDEVLSIEQIRTLKPGDTRILHEMLLDTVK